MHVSQVCDAEGGGADRMIEFMLSVAWGYTVMMLLLTGSADMWEVVVTKILHLYQKSLMRDTDHVVSNTILQHVLFC